MTFIIITIYKLSTSEMLNPILINIKNLKNKYKDSQEYKDIIKEVKDDLLLGYPEGTDINDIYIYEEYKTDINYHLKI